MNKLQMWLMRKYCPEFEEKMPSDEPGTYQADAYVTWGYWGNHSAVVESRVVEGYRDAYLVARWMALKAQFWRPQWFMDTGIHYGVKAL